MLAHQIEFAAQMSGNLELLGGKIKPKSFEVLVETEENLEKSVEGFGEFTIAGVTVESDWRADLMKVSKVNAEAVYRFSIV